MTEITFTQCLVGLLVLGVLFFSGPLLRLMVRGETPVVLLFVAAAILGGRWISRWSNPDFRLILSLVGAFILLLWALGFFRSQRHYDEKQREPVSATRYDEDRILVKGGRGEIERLINQVNIPGLMKQERVGGSFLFTIRHTQSWEVDTVVKIINDWGEN